MGLADTGEMLEACKADAAQLERDLTRVTAERDVLHVERRRLLRAIAEVRALTAEWDEAGLAGFPDEVRAIIGAQPDSDDVFAAPPA